MNNKSGNCLLGVGLIGTVVVALCCFTPLLVVLLGAAGLGALTGCLDFVLLPVLVIFLIIGVHGFFKKQKNSEKF